MLFVGQLRHPILHVGDALVSQRVGAQVGRRVVLIKAPLRL